MGKKRVGGTLFFSILLQWEKRVGGTLSDFHRTEGEKECSSLFLPICKVGKKGLARTLFVSSVVPGGLGNYEAWLTRHDWLLSSLIVQQYNVAYLIEGASWSIVGFSFVH